MRLWFLQFVLAALLAPGVPLFAQAQQAPAEEGGSIERERLEQLVETLESDTERAEFLQHLETLLAADAAAQPAPAPFRRFLDFSTSGNDAFARFIAFLNDQGLSDSTLSRLLALLALAAALLLAVAVNRRLAHLLNARLEGLRGRLKLSPQRFSLYFRTQVIAGYVLALLVFLYAVNEMFGLWFSALSIDAALSVVFTFLVIFLLFVTVWELVNGLMEFALAAADLPRARQQTLVGVLRNLLLVILVILLGLVVLSELGIDIMPLLAGAGVVGIALGFGAQALVKDYLNGFIVIFEDLFQVGDVIKVGDRAGLVENITLRKVQLRAQDGTVHTVPFGEVVVLDNLTKDFAYAVLDVAVAYRENVDEVTQCLREIDEEMRTSENIGPLMRAPLEILGVERLDDSAVIIRARSLTGSHDRWSVSREFNRRIKLAFDQRGIEMPFPHRTLYFGVDRRGQAPPLRVDLDHDAPAPRRGGNTNADGQ